MSRITNKKTAVQQVIVEAGQEQRRLDNFLMGRFRDLPRSRVYQMIRKGEVRVNGGRVRPEYRLQAGDRVRVPPLEQQPPGARPTIPEAVRRQLLGSVLHQDAGLIVLNKPPGIPVHGGSGRRFGVIDVLRAAHPDGDALQLVHRLDRDTSGCLMIARNPACLRRLHDLLRRGQVNKQYTTLLKGLFSLPEVEVEQPLDRGAPRVQGRMVSVDPAGKHARTTFKVIRLFDDATLASVTLTTGRTHQIRVHAASIGHPVLGDDKYGDRTRNRSLPGLKRLFLHASRLRIPAGGGSPAINVDAPLAADLGDFLDACE